jgi:peptidoglycan/xylan/chitin deacetylase (PgdA/CDA1 family)
MPQALKAKGKAGTLKRFLKVVKSYGITSKKMEANLSLFEAILDKYSCSATFPITAIVLKRHEDVIKKYAEVEFAIHGLVHKDYSAMTQKEQMAHLKTAVEIFKDADIEPSGFRAPYLSNNACLLALVKNSGLEYENSEVVLWNSEEIKSERERIQQFYNPKDAKSYMSLPRGIDPVIMPVSLPDDEILADRLRFNGGKIGEVWGGIIEEVYERGEMFVLQLHPERINECKADLENTLANAIRRTPAVWIAQLKDVVRWWGERMKFKIEINERNGKYIVDVDCTESATVLVKNMGVEGSVEWYNGYKTVDSRNFECSADYMPSIGVSSSVSVEFKEFLRVEGFHVVASARKSEFKIYFDSDPKMDELSVLRQIGASEAPIVRLWRWPFRARCALCITGDIDAMTIGDFIRRPFEGGFKRGIEKKK